MARATMAGLIARLAQLCSNDTTYTADDYERFLDSHAMPVRAPLISVNGILNTRFSANVHDLEEDAALYLAGSTTAVTTGTIDEQRGLVTFPAQENRAIELHGTAYNLYAAAADAWETIAARYALEFDFSDVEGSYSRSQKRAAAQAQAAQYRAKGGISSQYLDRADTPPVASRPQVTATGIPIYEVRQ